MNIQQAVVRTGGDQMIVLPCDAEGRILDRTLRHQARPGKPDLKILAANGYCFQFTPLNPVCQKWVWVAGAAMLKKMLAEVENGAETKLIIFPETFGDTAMVFKVLNEIEPKPQFELFLFEK